MENLCLYHYLAAESLVTLLQQKGLKRAMDPTRTGLRDSHIAINALVYFLAHSMSSATHCYHKEGVGIGEKNEIRICWLEGMKGFESFMSGKTKIFSLIMLI